MDEDIRKTVESYGWTLTAAQKGYVLFNRNNKLTASVEIRGAKYKIFSAGGEKLLSGNGQLVKAIDTVISKYFFGAKIEIR